MLNLKLFFTKNKQTRRKKKLMKSNKKPIDLSEKFNFEENTDDEEKISLKLKNSKYCENVSLEDKFGILLKKPLKRSLSDLNIPDLDFLHKKKSNLENERIKKIKKKK